MTALVNGLFVCMSLASVALWTRLLCGWSPRLSAVHRGESQTVARWSLFDLIVVLVFVFFPQMLAQGYVEQVHPGATVLAEAGPVPDAFATFLWWRSAALLAGTGLGIAWVWQRHRDKLVLGGDWSRWRSDLRLGVVGFLMLAPPVLLMQLALTRIFPSQHPLIDLVLTKPEPRFLWACGVAAVVAAPLAEEFQFRVLIQGWLQTAARPGIPSESWLVGITSRDLGIVDARSAEMKDATSTTAMLSAADPPRHWPAIATSALFALAHANHGPDPIPLFFLSWGIGWLYRGTSRVLPGVVVHFLLNLWTLLLLLVRVYGSSLT